MSFVDEAVKKTLDEVDERVCDLGRADAGGDRLHDAYLKGWLDALEWVRGEAGR